MNVLWYIYAQKEGRQRGTWSGKKADSDFYKKIVTTITKLASHIPELRCYLYYWRDMILSGGCIWGEKSRTDGREHWSESVTAIHTGYLFIRFSSHLKKNLYIEKYDMFWQGDMRSFLNASGGLTNQSLMSNGRHGADPSQSPLGGKTVHKSHYKLNQFSIDSRCI